MGIHLDVDRSHHGSLSKCNIEIHSSMQLEWLLIVGYWSLAWLLEVSLLQPRHYGNLFEQITPSDGDI